jgi:hypothetical protein
MNRVNGSTQQGSDGQTRRPAAVQQDAGVGLSIEVVLTVVDGLFFLLLGLLLIGIYQGLLPYSEDSTAGFVLVLAALQTITIGRTPIGDVRRSWFIVVAGVVLGELGTLSIFFPGGVQSEFVRVLAGLVLSVGGILGLVRLFTSEELAKTWMKVGGILRQLTVALAVMYLLEALVGVGSFISVIKTHPLWALVVIIFGISLFYVARCIQRANRQYRPEETKTSTM